MSALNARTTIAADAVRRSEEATAEVAAQRMQQTAELKALAKELQASEAERARLALEMAHAKAQVWLIVRPGRMDGWTLHLLVCHN